MSETAFYVVGGTTKGGNRVFIDDGGWIHTDPFECDRRTIEDLDDLCEIIDEAKKDLPYLDQSSRRDYLNPDTMTIYCIDWSLEKFKPNDDLAATLRKRALDKLNILEIEALNLTELKIYDKLQKE